MNARAIRWAAATVAALAVGSGVPGAPAASACGDRPTWSTRAAVVERSPATIPVVTGVRVGAHPTYDRIVLDLRGAAPGYRVRYVDRLTQDGSGRVVTVRGHAFLAISLYPARAHHEPSGASTLTTPVRTAWWYDEVRETAFLGDFEAVVSFGAGLARRAPFRVLTLHDPTRIVVDVRH